ncbi:MAG: hypothetical protein EZS28_037764, partial [Streblomastix strix]
MSEVEGESPSEAI